VELPGLWIALTKNGLGYGSQYHETVQHLENIITEISIRMKLWDGVIRMKSNFGRQNSQEIIGFPFSFIAIDIWLGMG
jgi:hypothetical protein